MACRKTERGAAGFEGDFDNDFLNWNPGSIKTSLALDFEDDSPPVKAHKASPLSKMNMDIDFDAGFSKLLSFNIDMPFCDGSPLAKQETTSKGGNTCTGTPRNIRRQQEDQDMDMLFAPTGNRPAMEKTTTKRGNSSYSPPKNSRRQQEDKEDMDMLFADDLQTKKSSEAVERRVAVDAFISTANECSEVGPDGPSRPVNLAHYVISGVELAAVPNCKQDDATKTDDVRADPENISRPEAGRGIPENQTANVPDSVPVLGQAGANRLEGISLKKSMCKSGSADHEDSFSTKAADRPEPQSQTFTQEPLYQPTSRAHAKKTISPVHKAPKLKARTRASGVMLRQLKPSLQRISEPPEIALTKPRSNWISTYPGESLKEPGRALKLLSVSAPDSKRCTQRLAQITVSGGEVKDFLHLRSSAILGERKCEFALLQPGHGQKSADEQTTNGKRKLSPGAVCPDTKNLEAEHLDVAVRPSFAGSLENSTALKLHVDSLGILRPSNQGSKGTSMSGLSFTLPCAVPKPTGSRDIGQLSQRSSYFSRLSEKEAVPNQFGGDRSYPVKKRVAHDRMPTFQGCRVASTESRRDRVCTATDTVAQPTDAQERTKIPSRELIRIATAGTSSAIDQQQPDLQDTCTHSAEQMVKFDKELDDFLKVLKSRHEEIKDLLVRACLLNSSWVLMNNPMDELKIKEIEEHSQQASK